ncbi:MAG: hypothetical protein GQ564_17520 [Bacteroidales bacterium]|nr:hypothetical protein [Bacteroidales bacterium]
MKNRLSRFLPLITIAIILLLIAGCEKDPDSLTLNITNNSTQTITSYTVETGSINMSEDPVYENSIIKNNSIAPGATTKVIIEVPENGTGDFEIVKLIVTVDGKEYENEDSFLFYNDQGNTTVSNAKIYDSFDESGGVYITIGIVW